MIETVITICLKWPLPYKNILYCIREDFKSEPEISVSDFLYFSRKTESIKIQIGKIITLLSRHFPLSIKLFIYFLFNQTWTKYWKWKFSIFFCNIDFLVFLISNINSSLLKTIPCYYTSRIIYDLLTISITYFFFLIMKLTVLQKGTYLIRSKVTESIRRKIKLACNGLHDCLRNPTSIQLFILYMHESNKFSWEAKFLNLIKAEKVPSSFWGCMAFSL